MSLARGDRIACDISRGHTVACAPNPPRLPGGCPPCLERPPPHAQSCRYRLPSRDRQLRGRLLRSLSLAPRPGRDAAAVIAIEETLFEEGEAALALRDPARAAPWPSRRRTRGAPRAWPRSGPARRSARGSCSTTREHGTTARAIMPRDAAGDDARRASTRSSATIRSSTPRSSNRAARTISRPAARRRCHAGGTRPRARLRRPSHAHGARPARRARRPRRGALRRADAARARELPDHRHPASANSRS